MAKEKEEDPQIRYEQMKYLYFLVESGAATEEQREILRQWAEKSMASSLLYEDSVDYTSDGGNTSDEDFSGKEGKAKEGKASESQSSSTSSSASSLSDSTVSEVTIGSVLSEVAAMPDTGGFSELAGDSTETGDHLAG
ncbi:MAG: hypothetical protein H6911_03270 [Rickettsiaceae bacterium]|nr:hypothetical protein [Rickettsiaceae bacterium]